SPLELYATDLNSEARQGRIDPLIGREHEVERVIQVLCRRRKNNPLLVGEAGVGKTAIAEGLAWRITQHDVPEILADAEVYALDIDRKSTRLNSSHVKISYAVFCLKKKNNLHARVLLQA